MNSDERTARMTSEFVQRFGHAPTHWVQAPGRVDLMGSHTDYNEGFVMTMAIDRNTWLAARPRHDRTVAIHSLNLDGESHINLDVIDRDAATPWSNYVRGVLKVFQDAGYAVSGFDGLIHSTIPFGSGLSSSAALEVATATLLQHLGATWRIKPVELARLCQQAENNFVGVNSGILDQYSSALGQAGQTLLLDCRHLTNSTASIPADLHVVICNTRAARALTGSEYDTRRKQCEEGAALLATRDPRIKTLRDVSPAHFAAHEATLPPVVAKRCRFIIEENQRVFDLAQALAANNREAIGRLTAASYAGARDLYEIGAPAMEAMIQAMGSGPGLVGARQAGAGFGGCMVAFVDAGHLAPFVQHVMDAYGQATGIEAEIYPVKAAAGAGILQM